MNNALHIRTTVLPGHKVEVSAPQLREGESVDVFLVASLPGARQRRKVADIIRSLPAGPRSASTWEELEGRFQEERESWGR